MALDLNTFASGDTDYIAKMNQNVAAIESAINALQLQAQAGGPGTALAAGMMMHALFNGADALIGPESYLPTPSGSVPPDGTGGHVSRRSTDSGVIVWGANSQFCGGWRRHTLYSH